MTFPVDQVFCVLDYETYSETPLPDVGAYEYAVHPSTEVICVAWRVGTRSQLKTAETRSWCPLLHDGTVQPLLTAMRDPAVIFVAHNALFEQVITKYVLARHCHTQDYLREIPVSRWLCTAAMASTMALPRKLEGAAKVLQLEFQKDMDGKKALDRICKPKLPSKKDPGIRDLDPGKYARVLRYCRSDIAAEVELFCTLALPQPMERAVWELDQKINLHGLKIDRPLVKAVLSLVREETPRFDQRVVELTDGAVASSRQISALRKWLQAKGVAIPKLAKDVVSEWLTSSAPMPPEAREILELRQAASKTSTGKYEAFEASSRSDGRCRDNFMYHRASTGRWAAVRAQPQNFPRGTLKDSDGYKRKYPRRPENVAITRSAIRAIRSRNLELVRLTIGNPMDVFASVCRGVIIAPEGMTLDVADYNAIETRVLFWMAGHEDGLAAFRDGRDLYREMAGVVYGRPPAEIPKGSPERFLGKEAVLGCGYGLGWETFQKATAKKGMVVPDELAQQAVKAYRRAHAPVPRLWRNLETAAISAVLNPGTAFAAGRCQWYLPKGGKFLYCVLPSGRRLAYFGPKVAYEANPFNEDQPRAVLFHYGENSVTKQWQEERTWGGTLTENIVQAAARDLLAAAMLRIDAAGHWQIVLHAHDEIMAERDLAGGGSLEEFCALMEALPPWAKGLPVRAEGWTAARYRK